LLSRDLLKDVGNDGLKDELKISIQGIAEARMGYAKNSDKVQQSCLRVSTPGY